MKVPIKHNITLQKNYSFNKNATIHKQTMHLLVKLVFQVVGCDRSEWSFYTTAKTTTLTNISYYI